MKNDEPWRYMDLAKHKESQATKNQREILMALGDLKNSQVKDIRLFLQNKREQEFEQICLTRKIRFTPKSKQEYVRKYTITRRTIHNHLDYLIDKKLVEHTGKKYTLSETVIKDTRYWARTFGDSALNMLMRTYWPQILTLEQNVDELINIFGIYMIYCFLEASRPNMDSDYGMSRLSVMEKDRLIDSWINEVFNPWIMFNYFVAVVNNILDDNEVQKILNNNMKGESGKTFFVDDEGNLVRPASGLDFMDARFTFLTSKASSYDKTTKPHYELDIDTINKIIKVLKNKYSNYYEALIEVKEHFSKDPKQEASSVQILDMDTIEKIMQVLKKKK